MPHGGEEDSDSRLVYPDVGGLISHLGFDDPAAAFAWQAGGGVIWEVTERLTFDVGYRFFQTDVIEQADTTQFQASELMFTLRLYEPFRGLLR